MSSAIMTKRLLAEAFEKLMQSTPFIKISVIDITKACGMNRNSFYYHFQDKYALLNWIFVTDIAEEIDQEAYADSPSREFMSAMSQAFYKYRDFYKNAMSYEGQNSFIDYLKVFLRLIIETRFDEVFEENNDPEFKRFFVGFFLDAFTSKLVHWVRSGVPYPPQRLIEMLEKTLTGGTQPVFNEDRKYARLIS